ncbi:MAG: histidine phosphatase family protein [Paracoccaceae bacterium]|nr:histidine phosphatase family protein [Paracoccaceae bacterium]
MKLILMRHAKSDWSLSRADHDRPLNPRGVKSARAMGDWLRDQGHLPDEVLCSTSARTRETLDLLDVSAPVRFERRLYEASMASLLDVLQSAQGASVLLLGHNPSIGALAHALVNTPPAHDRFFDYPTCATLVVTFSAPSWNEIEPGTDRALDFVVPRELV